MQALMEEKMRLKRALMDAGDDGETGAAPHGGDEIPESETKCRSDHLNY